MEKEIRNINDKLIKLVSRVDLTNARLTQIVHLLEDIDKKEFLRYQELMDNFNIERKKDGML